MRIQSANVALASAHSYAEQRTRQESLQVWVGSQRPGSETANSVGTDPNPQAPPRPTGDRHHGNHMDSSKCECSRNDSAVDDTLDPVDRMVKALIEKLFGVRINLVRLQGGDQASQTPPIAEGVPSSSEADSEAPQRQGWGVDYELHETRTEVEATAFSAQGVVRTADGKDIKFNLSLEMQRAFTEESSFSFKAGDALIDPLVVNFGGTAAQLTQERYAFDLNADGQQEQVAFAKGGSAFLALDKNGDGKISNGKELFGPSSGNGFSELAAYDADHNSWIDENDPVYADLRLMSADGSGGTQLATLAQKNVGAIYLGNAATPFTMKTDAQETQGEVVRTGVFLNEQGGAGTIQQVNLVA